MDNLTFRSGSPSGTFKIVGNRLVDQWGRDTDFTVLNNYKVYDQNNNEVGYIVNSQIYFY